MNEENMVIEHKKDNKLLVIILVIIIILLSGYLVYDKVIKDYINNTSNEDGIVTEEEEKDDNSANSADYKDIDLSNPLINNYYKYFTDWGETSENSLDKSESVGEVNLTTNDKFNIARHLYIYYRTSDTVLIDGNYIDVNYVKEEDVKRAYESLFGMGTYQRQESIPTEYCGTLFFDASDNTYKDSTTDDTYGCGGVGQLSHYSKVISAKMNNEEIQISFVYIGTWKSDNQIYVYNVPNNFYSNDCLKYGKFVGYADIITSSSYSDDDYQKYIEDNKDKLAQYTIYLKNINGFYYINNLERTKN